MTSAIVLVIIVSVIVHGSPSGSF